MFPQTLVPFLPFLVCCSKLHHRVTILAETILLHIIGRRFFLPEQAPLNQSFIFILLLPFLQQLWSLIVRHRLHFPTPKESDSSNPATLGLGQPVPTNLLIHLADVCNR